jgi:glutathione peroxidase
MASAQSGAEKGPPTGKVHTFTLKSIDGEDVRLSDFKGNLLLLVNTASKCGYTPQYAPLEELKQRYRDRGLRVLAFPANNFGAQEPGSNVEIKEFCTSTYGITFDLFEKISVKGEDIHPLYRFLTTESGFPGEIRWNFTKFLVDREGNVVARFETKVDPLSEEVISEIEKCLNTGAD